MLNGIRITKVRFLDAVWFIYLTLMMSYVFTGSQQIYTSLLTIITLFHMVLTKRTKLKVRRFSGFIWYLIFALYVNLSLIWSVYGYNRTGITGWVIYISAALFCLDYAFDVKKDSIRFWNLFVYAGAIFCIVALVTSPISTYATSSFSGITGHYRTMIGNLATILFGINIYLHRYFEKKKTYLVFAIIALITMLASGARGALLLLVIEMLLFWSYEKKLNKKILYIFLGILAGIIFIAILLRNNALYQAFVQRVIGALHNDGSTNSVNERWFFIETAVDLFLSHPILGCGVDTVRGYLDFIGYSHVTYSHCEYVELLSSYGIVGTTLYIAPAIKRFFTRKKKGISSFLLPVLLCWLVWSTNYYAFISVIMLERLQFDREEIAE